MKSKVRFGVVLQQYRQVAGISQEELAHRAGLHRTYISQLERGLKSPTLDVVFTLAPALKVPAKKFLADICEESGL